GALMAGTGAVKHEVGHGHQTASAAGASARQPRAVSEAVQRVRLPSPANRRQRVVVKPATSSTAEATAPVSRAQGLTRIIQPRPTPHRAQPSPGGGGGPQGGAPGAGPPGGDHFGGPAPLAQASASTGPGDCPPSGDRDPGHDAVSPS